MDTVKEKFILELMAFSPKYNAILAEEIASQMSQDDMVKLTERLTRINEKTAEELAELEENDPVAFDQKMREIEEAEEAADEEYFSKVEQKMLSEISDEENQKIDEIEKEMDSVEKMAEEEVEEEYAAAEDLLKALFEEVQQASSAQ
jgi:hypothetical protein